MRVQKTLKPDTHVNFSFDEEQTREHVRRVSASRKRYEERKRADEDTTLRALNAAHTAAWRTLQANPDDPEAMATYQAAFAALHNRRFDTDASYRRTCERAEEEETARNDSHAEALAARFGTPPSHRRAIA